MTDLFEEVEDELRREQLKKLATRTAPWLIGLLVILLIVGGGTVGYLSWQTRKAEHAATEYDAAIMRLNQGDLEGAFLALGEIAAHSTPIYKYMALSHQAGIRVQQMRPEDAVVLLDMAADEAPRTSAGVVVADIARLKAALLLLDTAPYDDLAKRLEPLAGADRPYSLSARFALGVAKLKAGRNDEAKADFTALSAALDAPASITEWSEALVAEIDTGGTSVLNDVLAQSAALPAPQMQITPEMLQQLMQQQGAQGAPPQ